MPPQFSDYFGQGQQAVIDIFDPKRGETGRFWNDDYNKQAFDIANSIYQNEYNAYQAELAFNRQKELINAQNEYNTPANQLARYMAAGLNPSMIYGQVSPGMQTNVASYEPPKAAAVQNSLPGTTEKLGRAMSVISTIGSLFNSAANIASSIEGVKNQNLQNQILEARLPAEQMRSSYESALWNMRETRFWDMLPAYDENNNLVRTGNGQDLMNILFPDIYRGAAATSKAEYQNWWNEKIAPLYEKQMSGKSLSAEEEAQIKEYNLQMLEALPPAVRPYAQLFLSLLNGGLNAYGTIHR